MRIWLIKVGEPLPTDPDGPRLLRMGLLAEALAARGHEVLWWSTTVDHAQKRQRFASDTFVDVKDRYRLCAMRAPLYRRNISITRVMSHRRCGQTFSRLATSEPPPDLILSALPTIELSEAAVEYADPRGIPVVLDMRDMWPDIILDLAPRWAQGAARVALAPMLRAMRDACTRAAAIVGITPEFVDWGLSYAGRPRSRWDRHFPHIFKPPSFDQASLVQAQRSWQEQGIGRTGQEFVACFFGTMGIQAEIPSVIEAARRLRDADRAFQFVLCGTGDHLGRYRRMAEGVDNVVFPGWIAGSPMSALMEMASVGLHPYRSSRSYVISWPSKSIQYLAAGLPVVSSLRGALENLLAGHRCGVTYQNENGEALASVLLELSRQPGRLASMAANAKRLHASQFAAEAVLDAMCGHLEEIHHGRSRRLGESQGRAAA